MISSGSGQQVTGPVNGPVYQLKDIGGDVTFLQNRPFYRLERLASQPARLSAEDARAQPSRMLHARYEVVPFVGRSDLLGRLTEPRRPGKVPAGCALRPGARRQMDGVAGQA
jgi:hypothetical protein